MGSGIDDAMSREAVRGARELPRRQRSRILPRRSVPWLLIAPSVLLALAVMLYPFFDIIWLSVHRVSAFGVVGGFVGGENYRRVFLDPVFGATIGRTLEWTAVVVGGTVVISMPVALILSKDFYGRGLARTVIMLPWSISLAMAAIVWLWAFNGDHGMVNEILYEVGLITKPIQWLATGDRAFPIEILIGILVSIPFTVTVFLGGISSVPREIYEAARIDGAGELAQFRWLTLPLLKPFITIAVVLNMIYVFNSFPIIWVMTRGGPDNSTHVLVTYLYEIAFSLGRPGRAAAVSIVMLAIVFVITTVYLRLQREEAA